MFINSPGLFYFKMEAEIILRPIFTLEPLLPVVFFMMQLICAKIKKKEYWDEKISLQKKFTGENLFANIL